MEHVLRDGNVHQGELLEEGEVHGRHDLVGEITIVHLGNEEGGCRAERGWQQLGGGVADIELLELGECQGVKSSLRLGAEVAGAGVAGVGAVEVKSAGGARVLGDYLGDGGG